MEWGILKFRITIGFLWGIPMFLFGVLVLVTRLMINVDGLVTSAKIRCQQPYNNRCTTTHILQSHDGMSKSTYKAKGNDASLSRDVNVGSYINKNRWDFEYKIDGIEQRDYLFLMYLPFCIIGFALIFQGTLAVLSSRKLQ